MNLIMIEVTAKGGCKVGSTFRKKGWVGATDQRIADRLIEKDLAKKASAKK